MASSKIDRYDDCIVFLQSSASHFLEFSLAALHLHAGYIKVSGKDHGSRNKVIKVPKLRSYFNWFKSPELWQFSLGVSNLCLRLSLFALAVWPGISKIYLSLPPYSSWRKLMQNQLRSKWSYRRKHHNFLKACHPKCSIKVLIILNASVLIWCIAGSEPQLLYKSDNFRFCCRMNKI